MNDMDRHSGRWMKPAECARQASVTKRTVVRWIHEGKIPARKFGRVWRIHSADWEVFCGL